MRLGEVCLIRHCFRYRKCSDGHLMWSCESPCITLLSLLSEMAWICAPFISYIALCGLQPAATARLRFSAASAAFSSRDSFSKLSRVLDGLSKQAPHTGNGDGKLHVMGLNFKTLRYCPITHDSVRVAAYRYAYCRWSKGTSFSQTIAT